MKNINRYIIFNLKFILNNFNLDKCTQTGNFDDEKRENQVCNGFVKQFVLSNQL